MDFSENLTPVLGEYVLKKIRSIYLEDSFKGLLGTSDIIN
jgi:hypothetical protein